MPSKKLSAHFGGRKLENAPNDIGIKVCEGEIWTTRARGQHLVLLQLKMPQDSQEHSLLLCSERRAQEFIVVLLIGVLWRDEPGSFVWISESTIWVGVNHGRHLELEQFKLVSQR